MHIVATSDFHGYLPKIPACDLLIIAGDICPIWREDVQFQLRWLDTDFRDWLQRQPAKAIVGIAGNHDWVFQRWPAAVADLDLPWMYLEDSGIELEDLKLYGLPWIPRLPGWAFYASEEALRRKYSAVLADTDILISHGPPHDVLDNEVRKFGTLFANDTIERVKPKLFICGHVHEGYGHETVASTEVYNGSFCDLTYTPGQTPFEIEFG